MNDILASNPHYGRRLPTLAPWGRSDQPSPRLGRARERTTSEGFPYLGVAVGSVPSCGPECAGSVPSCSLSDPDRQSWTRACHGIQSWLPRMRRRAFADSPRPLPDPIRMSTPSSRLHFTTYRLPSGTLHLKTNGRRQSVCMCHVSFLHFSQQLNSQTSYQARDKYEDEPNEPPHISCGCFVTRHTVAFACSCCRQFSC